MVYRDIGAYVTLLIEGSVPFRNVSMTGKTIKVISANEYTDRVPLCKILVTSDIVSGDIIVTLAPRRFTLPGFCQFLLGNNFGAELLFAKSVIDKTKNVTAAVTMRSKAAAKSKQTHYTTLMLSDKSTILTTQ